MRKGQRHSLETRARIGASQRGRIQSPETRAKIGRSQLGNQRGLGNRSHKGAPVIGTCFYCGRPATTRDHLIPKSRGGTDDPSNVVLACNSCNSSKKDRTPEESLYFEVEGEPGRGEPDRGGVGVTERCGAQAIFWPDDEACEAECHLPLGHEGRHEDEILGEWSEDELPTVSRWDAADRMGRASE